MGDSSRIPAGRGRALALADRISAGGTVAAITICLVGALAAGHSVLHAAHRSAAARPTQPVQAGPRSSPAPAPSPAPSATGHAQVTALVRDVGRVMAAEEGAAARREYGTPTTSRPIVQLTRADGDRSWVFGTTVIPVPPGSAAPPSTAFFVAHAHGGQWQVALSGSAAFGRLVASAVGKVVTAAEAPALERLGAVQAAPPGSGGTPARTGLALPWRTGQSWRLVAAFSGSAKDTAAQSMLAFAGGDGRVRAAGPGRLYRFCGRGREALIEIVHPDGTASVYYQLRKETRVPDGGYVAAGEYLGMTGTSLACGGTAVGPGAGGAGKIAPAARVVAFAVIGSDGATTLDGLVIGGWTLHARAKPPAVWAQRAAKRVTVGGSLRNFGTAGQRTPAPGATPAAPASPSPTPASSAGAAAPPGAGAGPSPAPNSPQGTSAGLPSRRSRSTWCGMNCACADCRHELLTL